MLQRAFEELRLPRIVSIVDLRNVASERILQKIGMKYQRSAQHEGVTVNCYSLDCDGFAAISPAANAVSQGPDSTNRHR
jgi:ribosomal-protein-alanine N-acetyltransferase